MNKVSAREIVVDSLEFLHANAARQAKTLSVQDWEVEDVQSWAVLKLIENDYRRVRSFRGTGPIAAFLARTVRNLVHDYVTARRRKWRPSSKARALGSDAMELERLTTRDGFDSEHAVKCVAQRNRGRLSPQAVEELQEKLPIRKFVSPIAPSPTKEKDLASLEAQRRLVRALQAALIKLSEAEVMALDRYFQSASLAQIARKLGANSRQIYHIHERALTTLRRTLTEFGLCELDIVLASRTPWEFFLRHAETDQHQGESKCEYSSSSAPACFKDARVVPT